MDGFGIICGVCKDNEKIQDGQAEMQRQLAANAREAERASERHLEEVRSAKWQAIANHEEAMRAESDRLEELQKQTQILLEGQITNEEAYQRGFDLEDEYLNLLLTEDGRVYWEIYEPYLVARLNAAYEKGAQDRLEKEFESNYPGLEYMKQEAYGHGYAGSRNCSIVYLHHIPHIYPAKLDILSETGLKQTTSQETGKLEWQWMPTYMSEELNDAYDAGAQKFLGEQNTAELVAERLEKNKAELMKAEESAKEQAEADLKKQQSDKGDRRKKLYAVFATVVIAVIALFGYWKYDESKTSYLVLRDAIQKEGWKPLVRPPVVKNWKKPFPEVLSCYEGYCESEFVNKNKPNKVRTIVYEYCGHPYGSECTFLNPKDFMRTYSDQIVSRKKADEGYEVTRKHFEQY
ncbi:MAG: hypothetical protein ACOYB0_06600 [Polynucleobacter sp.]